MASQTQTPKRENRENDFLDMSVGTGIAFIFFMGIALLAMIAEIIIK
mgnify:CR=1 FL=1